MEFQALIDELSDICAQIKGNDNSSIQQLDNSKVWTTLFNVASNDMRNTALLYPMISLYATKFPNFRDDNKVIEKYVEDLLDESKNENERTLHSVAIFRWLSFLPSKLVPKVINSAIDIANKYLDEKKDVPFDFLLPLNDGELSEMEKSTLDDLYVQLQTAISESNPKSAASLCVYSTMCHGIVDLKPEVSVFNIEILPKFLKSDDEKDQLCGCYYMIFLAECLADPEAQEAVPPATELFEFLKPLVIHKTNEHIRKRANKALIKFIQTEFFLTEEIVKAFLSLFDGYAANPTNLPAFFKVISNFIFPDGDESEGDDEEEAENDVHLEIIQPIVDFISTKLADKSNHMVQGLSLDSVCDLGFKDKMFIEDLVPIGLDVSKSLINDKEVATYPYIANFLTILKEKFHDETVAEIKPLVPIIVSQLNSESLGTIKQRIYCAGAISQLLSDGIATEETNNVLQFVLNNLNCGEEKSVYNLCSCILPIIESVGEEKANTIFKSFVEDVKNTENEEYLTAWMTCLGKFIKHYNINEDSVNSIVALIMSGELKIYHGALPHISMPPIIAPFNFLRSFVKKYPSKAVPICTQVVEWLKFTPFSSMPTLLLPLIAGLESGCINENLAQSLASILKTFLTKLDFGDVDPLASVCTALNSLYQFHKQAMSPIIEFLNPLEKFATECYTENDDGDMVQEELVESMPAVATLTFNVYANDDDVKVLPELINPLLALLPFHPQVEEVPEILANICSMLENKVRFNDIVVNALKMFADVLLMKKADLSEFKFDDDLIQNMKQTLKSYCKNDKKMTNAVTSDFRTSRVKINRFNVLIREK